MRRRIVWLVVGVLLLLTFVGVLADVCAEPAVPIYEGMQRAYVNATLGQPYNETDSFSQYITRNGATGGHRIIYVQFHHDRVVSWETYYYYPRPLERIRKWLRL
jgi:hypothetical protein